MILQLTFARICSRSREEKDPGTTCFPLMQSKFEVRLVLKFKILSRIDLASLPRTPNKNALKIRNICSVPTIF